MPRCDQRFTPMAQRGQHWRWLWLVTAVVSTCFRNLGGETIGRVMLEPCLPFLDQPWAVYLRACWWFPNQRLNYIHDYIFPFLSVEVRQHVDCFGGILSSETAPLNTARCDPSSLPFCRKHLQYHQLQGKGIIIILSSYVSPYFRDIFPWRFRRSSRSSFRLAGSGSTSLRSTSARSRMLAPEGARIVDSAIIVWYQALLYPLNYSLYRLVSWLFFLNIFLLCGCQLTSKRYVCTRMCWIVLVYIHIYMCVLHEPFGMTWRCPCIFGWCQRIGNETWETHAWFKTQHDCCWMKSNFRWCVSMTHIHAIILIALASLEETQTRLVAGYGLYFYIYWLISALCHWHFMNSPSHFNWS